MQGFPGMFMKVTIYSTEQGFRQIYLHMKISGFGIEITKSTLCNGMYYIWLSMEELKHPGWIGQYDDCWCPDSLTPRPSAAVVLISSR